MLFSWVGPQRGGGRRTQWERRMKESKQSLQQALCCSRTDWHSACNLQMKDFRRWFVEILSRSRQSSPSSSCPPYDGPCFSSSSLSRRRTTIVRRSRQKLQWCRWESSLCSWAHSASFLSKESALARDPPRGPPHWGRSPARPVPVRPSSTSSRSQTCSVLSLLHFPRLGDFDNYPSFPC